MGLKEESDYGLIEWIQFQDDYPEESREALTVLYERYKKPLYKMLFKILSKHGVQSGQVVDLVTDTFHKISVDKLECRQLTGGSENSFLYWLTTIAKNLYYGILNDQLEKNSRLQIAYNAPEEQDEIEYEEEAFLYPNEEIIVDYVQNLQERDREILLSYFDYYEEGKYTPTEIMSELALRHKTSVDYIRNVRNRLKKRVFEELSDKIQTRK
ncbi:MAG: hypothetical protein RIC35_15290 [Marinoscillum sp.]